MPQAGPCQAVSLCIPPSLQAAVLHQAPLMVCGSSSWPVPLPLFWPLSRVSLACGNVRSPALHNARYHASTHPEPRVSFGAPRCARRFVHAPARASLPCRPLGTPRVPRRVLRSHGATGAQQECGVPVCTRPACRLECRAWAAFPQVVCRHPQRPFVSPGRRPRRGGQPGGALDWPGA